jgi:hypothetical protein
MILIVHASTILGEPHRHLLRRCLGDQRSAGYLIAAIAAIRFRPPTVYARSANAIMISIIAISIVMPVIARVMITGISPVRRRLTYGTVSGGIAVSRRCVPGAILTSAERRGVVVDSSTARVALSERFLPRAELRLMDAARS